MATVEERLIRLEAVYEHLATKTDVADLRTETVTAISDLRTELKGDIGRVESQISGLRSEMKADIGRLESQNANLRAEMYRINATFFRWTVSLMAGSLLIGLGAVTAIVRFLG